jgi:hypothetical protein
MGNKRRDNADSTREVKAFLDGLKHRRKEEVLVIQNIILSADSGITERIKWNAPSFCIDDDDRITFRLQPGDRVELIFHRGVAKRDDAATFSFKDGSGLLEWVAEDRAMVTFRDLQDVKAKSVALKDLVRRWMSATRGKA